MDLATITLNYNLVGSKSEFIRLIRDKAVRFFYDNGGSSLVRDRDFNTNFSGVLKIGKRRFLRILKPWTFEKINGGVKIIKDKRFEL